MNSHVDMHPIRLRPPYFSAGAQSALHRYFDPEFVPRFQQDLLAQDVQDVTWQQEDRFSSHDNKLVLRLPMHRSFYLVSCEVACDRLGLPALAPEKIASAGFVIRRLAPQGEQSWMLENETAVGWEPSPTGLRDPDLGRRVCRNGRLHTLPGNPAYSGEQTHPLHALTTRDANGKCHTILYGYLPLGGSYTLTRRAGNTTPPFDAASLALFKTETARQLPWPYGLKQPLDKTWKNEYTRPIHNGVPTAQCVELLKMLLNRYHLGEAGVEDNRRLEELTQNLYFHDDSQISLGLQPATFSDYTRQNFAYLSRFSLWSWLQANAAQDPNPLVGWLSAQEQAMEANPGGFVYGRLPPKPGAAPLAYSLYMSPGDAQEIRQLLDQRVLDHAVGKAQEIPLPKFRQGQHDVYQIVPFVRVKDDFGGERIVWADTETRSQPFRVAAPFDPHASRPSLIQMPSLKDLRRGMAKGVSMITPPDTFSLMNALNLKKGATEDALPEGEGSTLGIQWICSFSLPVITLVAMILLMIMISLLN
ncbi:MAG TPA: hypothetical protein VNR18_13900, partial [Hyphomicrobiales bacterium]|nr:hypothetical protein [Hyphomicrobiales bacterium]